MHGNGQPTMIPGGPGHPNPVPWPPPQSAYPLLDPPNLETYAKAGATYYRPQVPIDRARPWFIADPNVGRQPRRVVKNFTGLTPGTSSLQTIQCDIPATIYQLTGGSYLTTTGASVGLDGFKVRFSAVNGDRLDTELSLGSTLLGTGEFPASIGDTGWTINRGTVLQVEVRPLVANLAVDIVVWWIETRGPVNFGV